MGSGSPPWRSHKAERQQPSRAPARNSLALTAGSLHLECYQAVDREGAKLVDSTVRRRVFDKLKILLSRKSHLWSSTMRLRQSQLWLSVLVALVTFNKAVGRLGGRNLSTPHRTNNLAKPVGIQEYIVAAGNRRKHRHKGRKLGMMSKSASKKERSDGKSKGGKSKKKSSKKKSSSKKASSTHSPTCQPTRKPTQKVTPVPSRQPTHKVTPRPSRQPTHSVSPRPTDQPTHRVTPRPSTGSTSAPSPQTTLTPSATGTTAVPSSVSTTSVPSSSQTTVTPSATGTTAVPSSVATTLVPSSVQTTVTPSASATTAVPSSVATTSVPSPSQTTVAPSASATTAVPSMVATTSVPSSSQTTASPSATGTTAVPSVVATTSVPSSSQTTVSPSSTATTAVPSSVPQTPIPTIATPIPTIATPSPTKQTPSPTASTPQPTSAPLTPDPTAATPSPTKQTPSPTASTPQPTSAPLTPSPTAATPSPTQQTPSPTAPLTPQPTLGSTGPLTPSPSRTPTCADNPQDYNVLIDLQIQYPNDQVVTCSAEEDSVIANNIAAALNTNFPTTVPDWNGDAYFGPFVFDPNQQVNGGTARRSRQLSMATRVLQQGTCSSRAGIDCFGDVCRWGCVTASTTDCGTSSLTNWFLLGDDVKARLATLGYACLGDANLLDVVLIVEDPEATARTFTGQSQGDDATDKNVITNPNALLMNSRCEEDEDEAQDDTPSRMIRVLSELDFEFVNGNGSAPSDEDIKGLTCVIKSFFADQFKSDPDFVRFDVAAPNPKFQRNPGANKDTFEYDFIGMVFMKQSTQYTPKGIAQAMANKNFDTFIHDYVWNAPPFKRNEFYETQWVRFTAKGAQR